MAQTIENLSALNIGSQSTDYDWADNYNEWVCWEAGECDKCGKILGPVQSEMHHFEVDPESECEGYVNCDGPMMNYYYPCEGISGDDAVKIAHLPLCIVEVDGEIGLALTGGGMDLSWEICEAFICLGFLPPSYFCVLPRISGRGKSEKDQKTIQACIETLQILGRQYAQQANNLASMFN